MTFDETKATQVAAKFLKLAGGRLKYLALIKLLYKLDREALNRWGVPVTTDRYVSMKLGPVTSNIYNLIKGSKASASPTFWSSHIEHDGGYSVSLTIDPEDSELSKAEEDLIDEIFAADGGKDGFKLADECHRDFPEWNDEVGSSSTPIEIPEILSALGKSEEEFAHTESTISAQKALAKLLAS
ncbi:Panacea domain-containing protein [Silvibacterium sp.]|uniref:Panacea domain-containing protein n=1 Tax=Silvibacterium sp. TaxID=1964179 RepID=UPI0039E437B9